MEIKSLFWSDYVLVYKVRLKVIKFLFSFSSFVLPHFCSRWWYIEMHTLPRFASLKQSSSSVFHTLFLTFRVGVISEKMPGDQFAFCRPVDQANIQPSKHPTKHPTYSFTFYPWLLSTSFSYSIQVWSQFSSISKFSPPMQCFICFCFTRTVFYGIQQLQE